MNQFKCEICGGTSIIQIDERTYECQDCGLQYSPAQMEKLVVVPQAVDKEQAEATVEEAVASKTASDIEQEYEDFIEVPEAEQKFEDVVGEADTEAVPEHIESAPIEITESAETDNSTVAEEEPQHENTAETTEEETVIGPKVIEEEDVAYEVADEIAETDEDETDSQAETAEIGIVPWYKNIKIVVPSAAGFALAILAVVLLILFLPKENIPVSNDTSSDIQSTVESNQSENTSESSQTEGIVESSKIEGTQEPSESSVESSKEETNEQIANSSIDSNSTNSTSNDEKEQTKLFCPLEKGSFKIIQYYDINHQSVLLATLQNSSIYAAASGTVISAGYVDGLGYCVTIEHEKGLQTKYFHAKSLNVKQGDFVSQGQTIAFVGNTGDAPGSCLGLTILKNGEPEDPFIYFDF